MAHVTDTKKRKTEQATDRATGEKERATERNTEQEPQGGVQAASQKSSSNGRGETALAERRGQCQLARPATATPFSFTRRFIDGMDRLFGEFGFGGWSSRELLPYSLSREAAWMPDIEVYETEGKFCVRADLPGLRKEDLRVEIVDGQLVIEGERHQEHEETREGFYQSELSYGRFYRAIPLLDGVDTKDVNATFKDGVLTLEMKAPSQKEPRGRKIEIR